MGFILYCARFSVTLQPYNIYPNTMHRITLTYRHAAAPARHLQAGRVRPLLAVGAERFLPPHLLDFIVNPCRSDAAVRQCRAHLLLRRAMLLRSRFFVCIQ